MKADLHRSASFRPPKPERANRDKFPGNCFSAWLATSVPNRHTFSAVSSAVFPNVGHLATSVGGYAEIFDGVRSRKNRSKIAPPSDAAA